ncbi:MAG: hypothetical protein ACTTH8_05675 [Treponema sp.]
MKGVGAFFENLGKARQEILEGCEAVAYETAASMERYAKEKKVWNDRTGNARKGLNGTARRTKNAITAEIRQDLYGETGKEYGYYLEEGKRKLKDGQLFGQKYGILKPTIEAHAGMFFDGIEKALSKVFT